MAKVLLLNSGGVDSRLVAAWLKTQGHEIVGLYLDIGHGNVNRAKLAAQRTADLVGAEHHEWSLRPVFELMVPNPKEFFSIPFMTAWLFLTGAVAARALGCDYFASGVKAGLGTEAVWSKTQELINLSRVADPVVLLHPLSDCSTYSEAIALVGDAAKDVPLNDTVSCNLAAPCTWCLKCEERKRMGIDLG